MINYEKNNNERILLIRQSGIQIYENYIFFLETKPFLQQKNSLSETTSSLNESSLDRDQASIFPLNQQQTAFQIDQQKLTVSLINMYTNNNVLNFTVQKLSTLLQVKEILAKRICQCGFQKRFTVLKKIGEGGFSNVFLISQKTDNNLFACKVIQLSNNKKQQKKVRAFFNEIRILRLLNNPYVISQHGVYYYQSAVYLILQYIQGGTLLSELKNNLIKTDKQRWKIVYQLTSAVEYLRKNSIIHRDIKLQNVLVRLNKNGSKDYVLSDFGLSCQVGQQFPIYSRCGTFGFLAPQVLQTPKPDILFEINHKLDVFSLGIIYHIIFLGQSIFHCKNHQELVKTNKTIRVNLGSQKYDKLPYLQYKLLEGTLSAKPQNRLSTRELLEYIMTSNYMEKESSLNQNQKDKHYRSVSVGSGQKAKIKQTLQMINTNKLQKDLSKLMEKFQSTQKQNSGIGIFTKIYRKFFFKQSKK